MTRNANGRAMLLCRTRNYKEQEMIKLNAHNVSQAVVEMLYKCYGNIRQRRTFPLRVCSEKKKLKKANTMIKKVGKFLLNIPFIRRAREKRRHTDFVVLLRRHKSQFNPFKLQPDCLYYIYEERGHKKRFANCIKEDEIRISFHRHQGQRL